MSSRIALLAGALLALPAPALADVVVPDDPAVLRLLGTQLDGTGLGFFTGHDASLRPRKGCYQR